MIDLFVGLNDVSLAAVLAWDLDLYDNLIIASNNRKKILKFIAEPKATDNRGVICLSSSTEVEVKNFKLYSFEYLLGMTRIFTKSHQKQDLNCRLKNNNYIFLSF